MERDRRILVVDDSRSIRRIVRQDLEAGGYAVEEATNGEAGLLALENGRFDLVTLDIEMPGLSGFETCRRIRAGASSESARIPVIFITANDTLTDRRRGFDAGAAEFLVKPFPAGGIRAAVDRILRPAQHLAGLTALVVDDSVTSRTIVTSILRREGLTVLEAIDGEAGLEVLRQHVGEIDLVISDLVMPRMEGDELCRHIRESLALNELPVILLTGIADQARTLDLFQAGASDYLTKPFVKEELLARLTTHLQRALLRRRLEETDHALGRAREQASTARRAKGTFLTNMSHEIRTPMNAIVGLSELALRGEAPPKLHDYLTKINESAHSLLGLLNDILDFSKIEDGTLHLERAPFLLRDVMSNVADLLGNRAAAKGLDLSFACGADVPLALIGDGPRLAKVLFNLVDNAIKFTAQGRIEVKVELAGHTVETARLVFTVRDTGQGIAPDAVGTLFDAFTQVDESATRKHGGTGLGLAICRRLVEKMGGRLWVESGVGLGSTFAFTASLGAHAHAPAPAGSPLEGLEGLRVLVVDDNPSAREIMAETLAGLAFRVETASTGSEALERIAAALDEDPFELVLMDWLMPGIDGLEASRALLEDERFARRRPKIVMQTAFGREEILHQAQRLGVHGFLFKPATEYVLRETLRTAWGLSTAMPGPAGQAFEVDLRRKPDSDPAIRLRGARVLVTDDNAINREVAGGLLMAAGVETHFAADGREAVDAVTAGDFDAVLMDIQMPGMSGLEATQILRAMPRFATLPIIAMTAHASSEDREACLNAGMNDHVTKPVDSAALLRVLARWVASAGQTPAAPAPGPAPATQTSNALPDGLPNTLPGVDVELALSRLGGDRPLLLRLLLQFGGEFADAGPALRAAVETQDTPLASRLAHTLKGVAGNLAAVGLFEAAKQLEAILRRGASPAEAAESLRPVEERLWEVLQTVAHLVPGGLSQATPAATGQAAAGSSTEVLRPLLLELKHTFEASDLVDDTVLARLRRRLAGSEAARDVATLQDAIDRFDYPRCLALVAQLATSLAIPLEGADP